MTPTPRPYQRKAIAATYAALRSGKRCPLVVAPTGAGKTLIMALMVRDVVSKGKRAAVFAHRTELRDQAVATLARCGVEAGHSGQGRSLPVQVVSTQGATSCEEVPEADVGFLDEAHHYSADEWSRIPQAYPTQPIIGFTATPERADGRALDHLFDDLIVVAQPRELVELGHLVPCGLEDVHRPDALQDAGVIACPPVEAYREFGEGGRAVVFASTVEHAKLFALDFVKAGISCAVVHGAMASEDRVRALADFSEGRVRVLVNVFVLTEGWDCPSVDVVIIARKMASTGMYMQACGRGLRPSPGKKRMILLDLAGVSHLHGLPTDDRIFSLEGMGMRLANQGPRFCRACGELLAEEGPCPREGCGRSRRGAVSDPKYSRDPLAKYSKYATDDEATRVRRLAKFLREGRAKGYRDGWAFGRYRGTYQAAPPAKIVAVARAMAHGPEEGKRW
jgi:superfamily II DNA or RNA helicase